MEQLTHAERELVALGAALGSNCVPCIEYHIPEARRVGLTDRQIGEAVRLADKVRQVPAKKVLTTAEGILAEAEAEPKPEPEAEQEPEPKESGCAQPVPEGATEEPCCA